MRWSPEGLRAGNPFLDGPAGFADESMGDTSPSDHVMRALILSLARPGSLRAGWFCLVLVLVLGLGLRPGALGAAEPAPGQGSVRLAIVPRDPALREWADVLTATFTAEPGLALLERAEIQRVLAEQAATATTTATATSSADLQLGQQLGAQGLLTLALTREAGQTRLLVRLLAVQPGIILSSTQYPWPIEGASDWPPAVRAGIVPLLPKLTVPGRDAIPVSVVNLRSAVQSRDGQQLEKDLTLLLIHRLARQPGLFVLERQRLDELAAEKEMKGFEGAAAASFWNGRYLVEGVVDRDGFAPDRLTVHLRLTGPNGAAPIALDAAGPRAEPARVIDALARQLFVRLGQDKAGLATWDPRAEAARFLTEAEWALRWKAFEQARWAAESAWALGDRSVAAARLRVLALCSPWAAGPGTLRIDEGSLQFTYDRVYPQAIEPLTLALEHFATATPWLDAAAVRQPTNRWHETGLTALAHAAHHLSRYVWSDPTAPDVAESLVRLRAAARQVQRIVLDGEEQPTPATYATSSGRQLWQTKMVLGWLWEDGLDAVLADYTRLLDGGLSDAQRREFLFRDPRRPPLPAWTAAERAKSGRRWEEFLQERLGRSDPQQVLLAYLLRHQYTPTGELVEEPRGTYTRAVRPLLAHLASMGPALPCSAPAFFEDALRVIHRRQPFLWERPPGMPSTNALRDFRTNFVHRWAASGACVKPELLAPVFRTSDFEPAHLRAVLEQVRARTGSGLGQVPGLKQGFLRAHLDSGSERLSDTSSVSIQGLHRAEVFELLFDPADYDAEQGATLLEALRRFRAGQQVPGDPMARPIAVLETHLARLNGQKSPAPGISRPPSIPQAAPTQGALRVSQWLKLPVPIADPRQVTDLRLLEARYREGQLWIEARLALITNANLNLPRDTRSVLYRVDLSTLAVRHSSFRPAIPALADARSWRTLPRTFEVVGGQVYVSWKDQVLVSPAELGSWTPVPIPSGGQARLFGVGGRLYLGTADRMLEYNPATRESRVMASTRRRPAEAPLDQQTRFDAPSFFAAASPANVVYVMLGSTLHPWKVDSGTWGEPVRIDERGTLDVAEVTEDAALLRSPSMGWDTRRLYRFTPGHPAETLLQMARALPGAGVSPVPGPGLSPGALVSRSGGRDRSAGSKARWNAPTGWDPFVVPATLEPGKVWMLHRRVLTGPQQNPALMVFEDERPDALALRLEFNRPNPFPEDETRLMGARPLLVAAPEGIVLTGRLWPGFWFIPRADLDSAIAIARASTTPASP